MVTPPEVSVVIPTYNRYELLRGAVLSMLQQDAERSTFEIVIVDNNSADDTRAVVESLMGSDSGNIRYVQEHQQGNAYARNKGIQHTQGSIIAFIDDDVVVGSNWIRTLKAALDEDQDLSFVGGRILPRWSEPPPSWLTGEHWAPLALLDYGPEELMIAGPKPLGLLTANIALRRSVFQEVGPFSPRLQRVKDGIGSMEDHEFLMRVCRSGKKGKYLPHLIATALVDRERLTKHYHRRWHTGHGRFYAIMRDPEWERSQYRIANVPGHLYKQTALEAFNWFKSSLLGRTDQAFTRERQLRFFGGFFRQRQRDLSTTDRGSV